MSRIWHVALTLLLLSVASISYAGVDSIPALTVAKNSTGGQTISLNLQIVAVMTVLTLLPALLMTMTSFTRIIIVLAILRQAIGLGQTPTNQILLGISLFLTLFIMAPVFEEVNTQALTPYVESKIDYKEAISKAKEPIKSFMLAQTRSNDIDLFLKLANKKVDKAEDVPFMVLMPAFLTSELKTAFEIGFLIFLPFLILDLVVASVLMSLGMMMLSPLIISLPFKVMLFVLIDGWTLIIGNLAASFATG